jgi:hypothetical protein
VTEIALAHGRTPFRPDLTGVFIGCDPVIKDDIGSGTPLTEPSRSWIAAPLQALPRPKSEAHLRTTGGKLTRFELTNSAPSMAFSVLIPKLVYIR